MTPHHLLLSTEEIREKLWTDAVFWFCHPFIKIDGTHRHALAEVLLEGRYQDQIIYGSDHAPHSEWAKRTKNIWGIPNHQWAQIILAWFRSQGFQMNHPIVQKFFSQNINRVFQSVPEWRNEFRRRAGSILFTPSDYKEWISAPPRIHNGVVVNPWIKLLRPELKEYWVEPRKVA
jgi:dihydroorotase